MVSKRDATRFENELANILWDRGFLVVRGPSSGSGARHRFQPDLIAAKKGKIIIIEVKKSMQGRPVYIPQHQVDGLLELEERSGGLAVIATRIPWLGWRFHILRDLPETPAGRRKVREPEKGLRIYELEELIFERSIKLDTYLVSRSGQQEEKAKEE